MFGTAGVLKPATPEGAANEQKEELRPAGNSVLPYVPAIHCRRPTKNVLITRSSCRNAPNPRFGNHWPTIVLKSSPAGLGLPSKNRERLLLPQVNF